MTRSQHFLNFWIFFEFVDFADIYFYALIFQFFQRISIHMLNFNGDHIFSFPEIEHRIKVIKIPLSEVRDCMTWSIISRIQCKPFVIIL